MVCTGQEWFVRDRNGLCGTGMVCTGLGWSVQDRVSQCRTGLVSTRLSVGQCSTYRRGGQVWSLWDRLVGKGQVGQYGIGLVSLEES